MADRTIAPLGDAFLVMTAVISSLTSQVILALLGLGAGIVTLGAANPDTVAWGGLLWWAASGVFAAGIGGMTIAALGEGIDDGRKTALALIAWATAILIVAFVMALAAGGAASVFSAVAGPVSGMLEPAADGKMSEAARQALAFAAVSSVVALVLGAAAEVAGAIYAPETKVKVAKRA